MLTPSGLRCTTSTLHWIWCVRWQQSWKGLLGK